MSGSLEIVTVLGVLVLTNYARMNRTPGRRVGGVDFTTKLTSFRLIDFAYRRTYVDSGLMSQSTHPHGFFPQRLKRLLDFCYYRGA